MDGALHRPTTTLREQAERAVARIGSRAARARRAALREGLFQPCTWAAFLALGQAGRAGALAALAYCQDSEEAADAVQAAALMEFDPVRQAAAAAAARRRGLACDLAETETHARCARSRARREHTARAGGGADLVRAEHARRRAGIQDHLARALGGADGDPHPHADFGTGPLELLLREEAEALDGCDDLLAPGALALLNPPRQRGRPTKSETLEAHGQRKLPGFAPGGCTTKASGQMPPSAGALAPVAPPAQLSLFGRPDVFLI